MVERREPSSAASRRPSPELIAATLTPRDSDGRMDQFVIADYFSSLCQDGVDRLAVSCHTGRADILSVSEMITQVKAAVNCGPAPVVGVPWAPRSSDQASWARAARDAGAAQIMLFPPHEAVSCEQIVRAHEQLHEATALPITAFALYSKLYSPQVLMRLLESPAITAVKSAFLDRPRESRALLELARKIGVTAVSGEDRFLGDSLKWGFDDALVGLAAAAPAVSRALIDSWRLAETGDQSAIERFDTLSAEVDRFGAVCFPAHGDEYIQYMAWIAEYEGRIPATHSDQRISRLSASRSRIIDATRTAFESVAAAAPSMVAS